MLLIDKIVWTSFIFLIFFIGLTGIGRDKKFSDYPVLISVIVVGLLFFTGSTIITGLISIWMR